MKLNDEVIAHIAKSLQLAILTGTDIIDHLRMIDLIEANNELYLTKEFKECSEKNIQNMIETTKTAEN